MRTRWFALTLSFSLLSSLTARQALADPTADSVWMTDFAAAQAEATKLNRPLVVHFYGKTCPPCRQMEKEVLNTPQLLKLLDNGFVAVKLPVEKAANLKLLHKYGSEMMPTDVVLSPEGKVLSQSTGFVSHRDYLAKISKIDAKYAAEGNRLAKAGAVPNEQPPALTNSVPAIPDRAIASNDKLVPQPSEPRKVAVPGESTPGAAPSAEPLQDGNATPEVVEIQVAMDGYCPVTLRTTRTWKAGNKDFSLEHDGQVYYFTAADKLQEFKANPDRFAPRLLGCDPVVLAESDLAVRGSTKFGAFYEGSLFLFESAESRTKFKKTPTRYSQLKHALKPEDVKKIASNTDR